MNDPRIETTAPVPAVATAATKAHTALKLAACRALNAPGFLSRAELGRSDACGKRGRQIACLDIERAANPHVLVNITRDLTQGASFVVAACPDFATQAAVCRLLHRHLPADQLDRVAVVTCSVIDFLGRLEFPRPETVSQRSAGDDQTKNETK